MGVYKFRKNSWQLQSLIEHTLNVSGLKLLSDIGVLLMPYYCPFEIAHEMIEMGYT